MIIGYLFLSFCVATLSAGMALLTGYGILAALGFYVLGGCLSLLYLFFDSKNLLVISKNRFELKTKSWSKFSTEFNKIKEIQYVLVFSNEYIQ